MVRRVFPILGAVAVQFCSKELWPRGPTIQPRAFFQCRDVRLCPMGAIPRRLVGHHIFNVASRKPKPQVAGLQVVAAESETPASTANLSKTYRYEKQKHRIPSQLAQIAFCSPRPPNAPPGLDAIRFLEKEFVEYSWSNARKSTSDSRLIPSNLGPATESVLVTVARFGMIVQYTPRFILE